MNDLEFREQYKRLKEVHPHYFGSAEKMNTTWEYVKDLDLKWFTHLVDRIVMGGDPRQQKFDIGEAAIAERRARKSAQFAEDVSKATSNWKQITERGLENVLEKYGGGNLFEAVLKSKKGEI